MKTHSFLGAVCLGFVVVLNAVGKNNALPGALLENPL